MDLPKCAQAAPYKHDTVEGEAYYWCTCGLSSKQPFCDGSHKGTGLKSLCYKAEQSGPVYFCGCKQTKNPPFCDGSHSGS
jgi:CDGSH-type Zn-finger protein